ncbi:MAG: ribose-5-phosphate isomerase RpiA [Parvularculaceae bacterium]
MSADALKRAAAEAALQFVESGMVLGLGTGSTAAHFVDLLGARIKEGLTFSAVATSNATERQAIGVGIDIIEPDETTIIDLAVDGTDEADGAKNLIKGGGGALLREKIVANAAKRFVVIADASKKVMQLGAFPLPVEIDRFSYGLTVRAIRETLASMGYEKTQLKLRTLPAGDFFLSDGGNYILDCALSRIADAAALEKALAAIPGVVESGLFVAMADEVLLAGPDSVTRL